jgi:hypothetical protein
MYKIRNQEGLFSTGGEKPHWRRKGKVWNELRFIKSHLKFMRSEYGDSVEVVEYSLKEIGSQSIDEI